MNDRGVIIESPGLFTSVQDGGRWGYQRNGMPVSGAMDLFSLALANTLAGNGVTAAALEATMSGPSILFTSSSHFAMTGADMSATLNGNPVPVNTRLRAEEGDRLAFGTLKYGCRTYIAFSGGINTPPVMGSRSVYLRAAIGGIDGRALKEGDLLPLGPENRAVSHALLSKLNDDDRLDGLSLPDYKFPALIRVTAGPEAAMFGTEGLRSFLTTEYTVTGNSDRMGYRLSGEPVRHKDGKADILSSGVTAGTVQVPGDGQPIILMADRQTTGGYPRIATVITADLTLVAQAKPGDRLRFTEVSLETAQSILREMWHAF